MKLSDEEYTKAFDAGYLMQEHDPDYLKEVLNGQKGYSPEYLKAMTEGKEAYEKDRLMAQFNQPPQVYKDEGR